MAAKPRSWELLDCALHGHVHVGVGAATITKADGLVAHEDGGVRWHRCLRCDGWHAFSMPAKPSMPAVPTRDQITLPLRGRPLRDRYVLRLIALDRAVHVLFLLGIGIALLLLAGHRKALESTYDRIVNSLLGSSGGPGALRGALGFFHKILLFNPRHLDELATAALVFAALEATEMVGLWFAKRWAEYLTLVATAVFLPLEIYELTKKLSALKLVVFIVNAAIVIYLLFAKRLFGLRGGSRAEEALRRETSGWRAIEEAMPMPYNNALLVAAFAGYEPEDATEEADLQRLRALFSNDDPWSRDLPLHVTASALVVDRDGRVLLRWHARIKKWAHVGGHGDPGEQDPWDIALREAEEETGLRDLHAVGQLHQPVQVVVVTVPARGKDPAHEHADIRYVLATDHPEAIEPENDEAPLRWVTLEEASQETDEPRFRDFLQRIERLLADA